MISLKKESSSVTISEPNRIDPSSFEEHFIREITPEHHSEEIYPHKRCNPENTNGSLKILDNTKNIIADNVTVPDLFKNCPKIQPTGDIIIPTKSNSTNANSKKASTPNTDTRILQMFETGDAVSYRINLRNYSNFDDIKLLYEFLCFPLYQNYHMFNVRTNINSYYGSVENNFYFSINKLISKIDENFENYGYPLTYDHPILYPTCDEAFTKFGLCVHLVAEIIKRCINLLIQPLLIRGDIRSIRFNKITENAYICNTIKIANYVSSGVEIQLFFAETDPSGLHIKHEFAKLPDNILDKINTFMWNFITIIPTYNIKSMLKLQKYTFHKDHFVKVSTRALKHFERTTLSIDNMYKYAIKLFEIYTKTEEKTRPSCHRDINTDPAIVTPYDMEYELNTPSENPMISYELA